MTCYTGGWETAEPPRSMTAEGETFRITEKWVQIPVPALASSDTITNFSISQDSALSSLSRNLQRYERIKKIMCTEVSYIGPVCHNAQCVCAC